MNVLSEQALLTSLYRGSHEHEQFILLMLGFKAMLKSNEFKTIWDASASEYLLDTQAFFCVESVI